MVTLRGYQDNLLNGVRQAFRAGCRRPLVVAPCGAGKSYIFAKMLEITKGEGLVLTHREELLEQHRKLLRDLGVPGRVSMVLTEANRLGRHPKPPIIILDEAHLSRSNSWIKVIEHYNTFCVGFTATPIRLDGKPLGDIYDALVQGIGVRELIDLGNLAPFQYYAPVEVNVDGCRVNAGDYVVSDLERLMTERAIYGDVIRSYKSLADGLKTIAYCVSVRHAEQTAEMFKAAGYTARAISAGTPPRERKQIMRQFREGEITVLCNVGIISEGVSVDDVMCCILLRPTESHALYWQQAMRCMRYQPGKVARIIDCVGNYTRNPMPDAPVEWSLTKPMKRKPRTDEEGNFAIRVCKECFMTFQTAPVCPFCSAVYPLHPREIKAREEVELKRITADEAAKVEAEKKRLRQEVGQAKTYPELMKIAQERGYSRKWVHIQLKLKGRK